MSDSSSSWGVVGAQTTAGARSDSTSVVSSWAKPGSSSSSSSTTTEGSSSSEGGSGGGDVAKTGGAAGEGSAPEATKDRNAARTAVSTPSSATSSKVRPEERAATAMTSPRKDHSAPLVGWATSTSTRAPMS